MEIVFYLGLTVFVAVCLLKPTLIIGFRSKDKRVKSKEVTKNKEVISMKVIQIQLSVEF